MRMLNPRQRGFVDALFALGYSGPEDGKGSEAARMAGYLGNAQSLKVQAYRMIHSDKIQDAIKEEATRRVVASLPAMVTKATEIAMDDGHRAQWDAVKHSMAIADVSPKIKHEVVHKTDRASLVQEIAGMVNLLHELGVKVDLKEITQPAMIDITPEKDDA